MPELIPTADEAQWLEARRRGVTASEIAVVMGLSPWDSPYALYHRKLGILPPVGDSAAMERGRALEPYIAYKFAEQHPELLAEGDGRQLYAHAERSWQLATPDRLVSEVVFVPDDGPELIREEKHPVAVAEFKTASSMDDWGEEGTDEIPVHYRAQVLWQCRVMGVRRWHVACLDVPRWRVLEYTGEIDEAAEADLLLMEGEACAFLDRIDRREPPDVDWRPATLDALKSLHPSLEDAEALVGAQTASRYRAAVKNAKHWEQRRKLYEAHLRDRMGSARRAVTADGQLVARRDVYEVRESLRKGYTVDKLVPVPPKTEKES